MEHRTMTQSFRCARAATVAFLAATMLATSPGLAQAQEGIDRAKVSAYVEAARAELRANREALMAANLTLAPAESDAFWPLYREFNTKRAELGDTRLKIIMDYADKYPNVDDATAKDLVDRSLAYDKKLHKLEDSYVAKFRKALPAAKLMRFLQIDARIETLVEIQLQQAIPVVEPQG
jgi:hypothetical protein